MTVVACSCGVQDCAELGWPHEWDPIATGDTCMAQEPPQMQISIIDYSGGAGREVLLNPLHAVTEPYERWGSGYGCAECVAWAARCSAPIGRAA